MPKAKGDFWSEFEIVTDFYGKEKYKCKKCSGMWAKNASRLKKYIEQCKSIESETSQSQDTKCKK